MPTRYTLPNGTTALLEPLHTSRAVAVQVWVDIGSADETADEIGLAHLHEHMLFKGTERRGLGEIARSVEAHGGEINAWTSFDQTVYHVVLASHFAEEAFDVLSDAIRHSSFDAQELTREIEVVCEEIKRSSDMPGRRASKQFFGAVFEKHPYGRPVIGFESNVRSHTRERVVGFYRKHYTPKNVVIAAVGDFELDQAKKWVEQYFGGDWGRPSAGRGPRLTEPQRTTRSVSVVKEAVKDAHLHFGFHIPEATHEDTPALDVLAMIAGQGDASRMSLEIKRKQALAKDISAWSYTPKDPGVWATTIVGTPATLLAAATEAVHILDTLKHIDVDAEELRTVKALIEAEAIYQRETVQGLARKFGYYESALGGLDREAKYYQAIAELTPRQLREVAKRYFLFDRCVATALLPTEATITASELEQVFERSSRVKDPSSPPARTPMAEVPIRLTGGAKPAREGIVVEKLPDGPTVIVREERAVPLFAARAAFPGGLRYETPENNGLTTLLARTLPRGTTSMPGEAIAVLLDQLAGSMSAVAGRSSFSVRGDGLSKHFDRTFDLFADLLVNPALSEADFAREHKFTLQNIRAREDQPATLAFESFARTHYQQHPYRMSLLGEHRSVESLTTKDLRAYHSDHLDPSQMTLAVVGDVDAEHVIARAKALFHKRSPKAPPTPIVETPRGTPQLVHTKLEKAQTHLVLGFPGARVTDPWRRALEVISTILSGQSGRLFMELRDKRSMAYSVSAMSVEGFDPGYFATYIATSPEKVADAIAGLKTELTRIRDERVPADELLRAQRYLLGTHEIGLQRNGARAATMAVDALYGLGAEHYKQYEAQIMSLTSEQLRETAQRVINFEQSTIAVVGPQAP